MKFLVTGAAGFIGMHVCKKLLSSGHQVMGVDDLNNYYDVDLKRARVSLLSKYTNWSFCAEKLEKTNTIQRLTESIQPDCIIHLAAQAGVRYSIENPETYVAANLVGFSNILQAARKLEVSHFVYASSSSVYGLNTKTPFKESELADHPISFYGATKRANELLAHSYSHLYSLPTTGLRFFTVYGPWGRPDMALFKFTKNIISGNPIDLFNEGRMVRDFTYVDDIADAIVRVVKKPATGSLKFSSLRPDPSLSNAPYRIFNIGNGAPRDLLDYVHAIEDSLGIKAHYNFLPMQAGDVVETHSDTSALASWINYEPSTPIEVGVRKFVSWYKDYYS